MVQYSDRTSKEYYWFMGSDVELVGEHEKVQFEQSTELGGTKDW